MPATSHTMRARVMRAISGLAPGGASRP
jgi:hypothetical protein